MFLIAAILTLSLIAPSASDTGQGGSAGVRQPRILTLADQAIAYIPASAGPHPPLLVLLHGAGQRPAWMIEHLVSQADARGIVLVAPASRGVTWDSVRVAEEAPSLSSALANSMALRFTGSRDADRVEQAIRAIGSYVPVDRATTALAGFSDGATFALAMGMARTHPFAAIIAWSPGIAIETASPARHRRVFVSHGRQDRVLSFETTCAEIVPMLEGEGALVMFLSFDGGHEIPAEATEAFLDAVFGPAPGASAHSLLPDTKTCVRAAPDMDVGKIRGR